MTLDATASLRANYNATVVQLRRVHDELIVLRVRPDAGVPAYEAGQWISLGIGVWEPRVANAGLEELPVADRAHLVRRPFSISSPLVTADGMNLWQADRDDFYEFYFGLARQARRAGILPSRLFALESGGRLWVDERPRGANTLRPVQPSDNVLFLATGTGEAPHNRMIWELLRRGHRGRIASVVTTRRRIDQGYRMAHERLAELFPNYHYAALATRDADASGMRLQEFFRSGAMEHHAGFALDPAQTRVFLCGSPDMIGAPRFEHGARTAPRPGGMIELLETERGFRVDESASHIKLHFERSE